jgi:hypothetical protein
MGVNVAFDMRSVQQLDDVDPVTDLVAFASRCETRGHMVAAGLMTVQAAVDGLWEAAELPGGPLRFLDVDSVQEIMANAFGRGRNHDGSNSGPVGDGPEISAPPPPRRRSELAASTIDALRYVVSQRDPQRLRRFLKGRTPAELAAMQRLMVANDRKN